MITIIFAPPRKGKTCLMTHLGREMAFDRHRNHLMQMELFQKQLNGFANIKTIPKHCLSANYDVIARKFGYSPRLSRRINPYRLGFANSFVKTHFNFPYECILIQEGQKYLNSRMSMYFPEWQSRWYEQHGHDNIDIFIDTQRPMLIDVNIRELASFIEVVKLEIIHNDFGKICAMCWFVRKIENSSLFDKYMSSGKKDTSCYTEDLICANYNVFDCYNSQSCKPKFYEGHFDEDFDIEVAQPTEETLEGYVKFLQKFDDELPDNFYQRRKAS